MTPPGTDSNIPGADESVLFSATKDGIVPASGTPSGNVLSDNGTWVSAPTPDAAALKATYESNANTNAYTDAEKTKLAGISGLSDAEIKTAYENNADTNALTDAKRAFRNCYVFIYFCVSAFGQSWTRKQSKTNEHN